MSNNIFNIGLIDKLKIRSKTFSLLLSCYNQRIANIDHLEIIKRVPNAYLYPKSYLLSLKYEREIKNVKQFCIFLGYSRSGHSIIGSLIDAHPNAIIGHEVDVLYLSQKGYSRNQIITLIIENSKNFAKFGRGWSGYSYEIKNQYQGKSNKLLLIGDKMGEWTSIQMINNEQLMDTFKANINMSIKYIHHVRNPFDIISSSLLKKKYKNVSYSDIDNFLKITKSIYDTKKILSECDIFEKNHEYFITNPKKYLEDLCSFLNLKFNNNYINSCLKIINPEIKKPRYDIVWSKSMIKYLSGNIKFYPYLRHYSYYK